MLVRLFLPFSLLSIVSILCSPDLASAAEESPVRLAWREGDVSGFSSIVTPDSSKVIGIVEFQQRMRGGLLEIRRVARFLDGSSDEDQVEVKAGKTLESVRGRMIIRDTKGRPTVDLKIDIAAGRITGFSGIGAEREEYDEQVEMTGATYWGPLIFLLLKNFEQNAVEGKLEFKTVVATPKPRLLGMELVREDKLTLRLRGSKIPGTKFVMRLNINPMIDPILRAFAPDTFFFLGNGAPPAMIRFEGPRNYADQKIRIE